ncbi:MAG: hypothetical protein V3T53_10875 [Phycisphaerales bacterium]
MDRVVRIQTFTTEQRQRAVRGYRWLAAQPSWVVRLALVIFVLVIGLPLLLLAVVAVIAAIIVFTGLAIINAAGAKLRGLLPKRDGRSNVRVIRRD